MHLFDFQLISTNLQKWQFFKFGGLCQQFKSSQRTFKMLGQFSSFDSTSQALPSEEAI